MRNTIYTKTIAILIVVFATVFTANAQPGSYEYEMRYGREALNAKNYVSAQVDFELAIARKPDDAEAHFLFAQALLGNSETEKARAEFNKAAALDPSYSDKAKEFLGEKEPQSANQASRTKHSNSAAEDELAIYVVGDSVEVSEAGRWTPGVVTKVEGSGRSVRVTVKYVFNGDEYIEGRNYNGVRHAAKSVSSGKADQTSSNTLDYGDYVCEQGLRATGYTPKGYFTLKANGTYSYPAQGSSGKFQYNAENGEITWLSGYFANGGDSTTKFTPGNRVSQIDITFHTKSGELYWSCGHNK